MHRQRTGQTPKKKLLRLIRIKELPSSLVDSTLKKLGKPFFIAQKPMGGTVVSINSYCPRQIRYVEPLPVRVTFDYQPLPDPGSTVTLPSLQWTKTLTVEAWTFDSESGLYEFNPRLGEMCELVHAHHRANERGTYEAGAFAASALVILLFIIFYA